MDEGGGKENKGGIKEGRQWRLLYHLSSDGLVGDRISKHDLRREAGSCAGRGCTRECSPWQLDAPHLCPPPPPLPVTDLDVLCLEDEWLGQQHPGHGHEGREEEDELQHNTEGRHTGRWESTRGCEEGGEG